MRFNPTLTFVGIATALAGAAAVSAAAHQPVHVMVIHLPGGGIEQIRYTGNTPPPILVRDEAPPLAAASFLDTAFGPDSPFAELDRISAEMDRQAAVMMRQAALMQSIPDAELQKTALAGAPAGVTSFTMISTSNGSGTCSQSVRMVSMGEGKVPRVTRTSSGACGTAAQKPAAMTPTALPAAPKVAPAPAASAVPAPDSI